MAAFIFGVLIFGGGAAMMGLHWDTKFRQKFQDLGEEEARYRSRQYIRRMITSGTIALIGILFVIYQFLPERSIFKPIMVITVFLLIGLITVFAFLDARSILELFRIERKNAATASRNLADELVRLKRKAKKRKRKKGNRKDSESLPDDPG